MSKAFRTNINLAGNQLIGAAIQPSASAPSTNTGGSAIVAGQMYYNTSGTLNFYNGSSWVQLTTGTSALASLNGLTVATTLQGTTNQITVTTSSPNITLSFPTAGVTLPGKTTLTASTTSAASINIPSGSAPNTPASGDAWNASGSLNFYNGTATKTIAFTDSSITGNSATATALQTARTINGTSFDGTANITVQVPISTGVTGLGTNVATFLATPSSSNLISAMTDETGTGSIVFSGSPTFTGTVTLPTGSTSNAPLKFVSGTNTTAVVAGAMEFDGTNLLFSPSTTRKTIAFTDSNITGSAATLTTARTINGVSFNGSGNITITAANPNALTIGTGLSGTSYDGSSAVTITNSGVTGITGTSNQVIASASTGSVTLSLPQSINTTATPTFNQITLNNSPSNATDVATKQYVDNIASGINAHDSVVAATTAALTVNYNNNTTGVGATLTNAGTQAAFSIDNVTPVSGDRVLIKNQASTLQNGIYVVTTVGSGSTNWVLTRASDYDQSTAGEVAAGDTVFVVAPAAEFSTTPTNQNTGWTMNTAGTITIGTSAITFAQSSGTGTVTATNGLTIVTGNQVGVNLGSAFDTATGTGTSGLSISGNTLQVRLDAAGGLTSTTAGLKANLGTGLTISSNAITFASGYGVRKYTGSITGDTTTVNFPITHSLGTNDVTVRVYQTSTTGNPDTQYADIEVDITRNTTNQVTIGFATAPAVAHTYNVVVIG